MEIREIHKVKLLNSELSETNLTAAFGEIGKRQLLALDCDSEDKQFINFFYHGLYDEKNAVREAAEAVESDGGVRFKIVNKSDLAEVVKSDFIKKSKINREYKRSKRENKRRSGSTMGLVTSIISLIGAIIATGVCPLIYNGFKNNPPLRYAALLIFAAVIAVLITVCAFSLFKALLKRQRDFSEFSEKFDAASIKEEFCESDFNYSRRNVIYIIDECPADDEYYKIFENYLKHMPKWAAFSCIISRVCNNYSAEAAAAKAKALFAADKRYVENINGGALVYGYYLKELTNAEKAMLISEFNIDFSGHFESYGRDYIYAFRKSGEFYFSKYDYAARINDIYNFISGSFDNFNIVNSQKEALNLWMVSFLASLKKILPYVPRTDVRSREFADRLFTDELLNFICKEFLGESGENRNLNVKSCLYEIWSNWNDRLIPIADREHALLSDEDSSFDGALSPYEWAIKCFLDYVHTLKEIKRNEIYSLAAYEIDLILKKVIIWNKNHDGLSWADYFVDKSDYLDIILKIVKLNLANGFFVNNHYLLEFIQSIYDELEGEFSSDRARERFVAFYVNDALENAYTINSVVSPSVETEREGELQSLTCFAREMHKLYLKRNAELAGKTIERKKMPSFFELFGTREDSSEYYSLLKGFGEDNVIEFYKRIYFICKCVVISKCQTFQFFELENDCVEYADDYISHFTVLSQNLLRNISQLVDKLKEILGESVYSIAGNMLKGELSREEEYKEILSWGILKCDIFYLLHDLYLWQKKATEKFDCTDKIVNKSYKLVDMLIYNESMAKERFNVVFSDMVQLINRCGRMSFFIKYFLAVGNYNDVSPENKRIINDYLSRYNDFRLRLTFSDKLSDSDVRNLLRFCFNVKNFLNAENFDALYKFADEIAALSNGRATQEFDDLISYALKGNVPTLTDEESLRLVERLKGYSDAFCYMIFNAVSKSNPEIIKHVGIIADKLPKAGYANELLPLIESLKYNKDKRIITLVVDGIADDIKNGVYAVSVLSSFLRFFNNYGAEINEIKTPGYSERQRQRIEEIIIDIKNKSYILLKHYLEANKNFIVSYSKAILSDLSEYIGTKSVGQKQSFFELEPLVLGDDGKKSVCLEYLQFIKSLEMKATQIEKQSLMKIINDLIELMTDRTVPLFIRPEERAEHVKLLNFVLHQV